jgi:hypothetical protein
MKKMNLFLKGVGVVYLAFALFFSACQKNSSEIAPSNDTSKDPLYNAKQALLDTMRTWYYWNSASPQAWT